ncbi:NUDIX hydrolase [Acinetobacter sp. ANC 4558]|uniref:NUDIX hydrolase n=1 Tax=Acinetobacter sp. ANC 4558 TaxID=1977876 RepID=UPI000A355500|nr:NUDIX domain-containing protein [Acinetobacter sp. ANC 4558]OTG87725.1 NUDIX hydrolase [Acinetobacter sp. ANC 4558]
MAFHDLYRLSSHAVITNVQNQVLLLKANYAECVWGLPGGALDMGETIHQALIRECFEELNCHIQVEYLSGVYFHAAVTSHAFIFRCSIKDESEVFQLSAEHSAFKWFNLSELTAVQRIRVEDCLNYQGQVFSRSF